MAPRPSQNILKMGDRKFIFKTVCTKSHLKTPVNLTWLAQCMNSLHIYGIFPLLQAPYSLVGETGTWKEFQLMNVSSLCKWGPREASWCPAQETETFHSNVISYGLGQCCPAETEEEPNVSFLSVLQKYKSNRWKPSYSFNSACPRDCHFTVQLI